LYEDWRERLIRCLAHKEAEIDFADDQALDSDIAQHGLFVCLLYHILVLNFFLWSVENEARALFDSIASHLRDARRGERLRTGLSVVIAGAPNAGKSSFLNVLGVFHPESLSF
jgi:tRNA modification GTPase